MRPVDLSELTSKAQLFSHTGHMTRARPPQVASGLCIQQHTENISVVVESSAGCCGCGPAGGDRSFRYSLQYVLCAYVLPVFRILISSVERVRVNEFATIVASVGNKEEIINLESVSFHLF